MKRTIIMLLTAILLPIAANAQEKHEFSKSGYGAHAGIKHSTYTSAFGYYFTPFTMITAGLDLTWGKASLGLDYSLGKGKIRYDSSILMGIAKKGNADGPSYKEDVYIRHHKGDPYFPSDIMITLGYALLDNEHIKLGPMIGFGLAVFTIASTCIFVISFLTISNGINKPQRLNVHNILKHFNIFV